MITWTFSPTDRILKYIFIFYFWTTLNYGSKYCSPTLHIALPHYASLHPLPQICPRLPRTKYKLKLTRQNWILQNVSKINLKLFEVIIEHWSEELKLSISCEIIFATYLESDVSKAGDPNWCYHAILDKIFATHLMALLNYLSVSKYFSTLYAKQFVTEPF